MAESLELTPFRRLIDDVQGSLTRHWRTFAAGMVGPLLLGGLLGVVLQRLQVNMVEAMGTDPKAMLPFFAGVMLLAVVTVMLYFLTFNAALVGAIDAVEGRPVSMARSWGFVLRPMVLLTQAVVSLVMVASVLLCLLPAVYMVPRLSYVVLAMYREGLGPRRATQRSASLIHFNPTGRLRDSGWLQTLVVVLLGLLIYYAVVTIVQLPFTLVVFFLLFRNGVFDGTVATPEQMLIPLWLQLPMVVVSVVATAFAWLYWVLTTAALYRELRKRREGDDLQEAIDLLTGTRGGDEGAEVVLEPGRLDG